MDYQQKHKHSVPDYVSSANFERQQPARTSHSSPASLNHEQWLRNYKESVREYGPSRNGQPSLFLFGRDEYERSELIENGTQPNQQQVVSATTPVNTPLYPTKSHDEMEHVFSAPGSLHHHKSHEHKHLPPKNSWPYGLSNEERNEKQVPDQYSLLYKQKYATLPKRLDLSPKEGANWPNKKSSDPSFEYEKQKHHSPSIVDWPSEKRRTSSSWPAVTPKMRYIYAYPEEVPAWIQYHESQKHAQSEYRPKLATSSSFDTTRNSKNSKRKQQRTASKDARINSA
ncbi:hypothetical protein M3Y97_00118600 [Aphelenchoides bicaudatus]|nr:hypothetical protein M3Y97_00118600 [Aphelenchoides bicaudatus]